MRRSIRSIGFALGTTVAREATPRAGTDERESARVAEGKDGEAPTGSIVNTRSSVIAMTQNVGLAAGMSARQVTLMRSPVSMGTAGKLTGTTTSPG